MRRRRTSGPAPRSRSEIGSGSLEYVGVTILAAVLVAASVGAVVTADPSIRQEIWAAICRITGGQCETGDSADQALKPDECEIYSSENSVNATVDIAFFRLGNGGTVQRVEKSNGDIEITVLHEGRGGVTAGIGAKGRLNVGGSNIGAGAELEAALTGGYSSGDTYVFTDADQADSFQDYLQREMGEDTALTWLGPIPSAVNGAIEWATGEEAPTNAGVQKTYVRYDVTAEATANATAGYGASAEVDGSYMVALGSEFDRGENASDPADDTQTDFYQVDWSAGFDVGLPAVQGVSGSYNPSGIVKVKRNADDEVVQVQIIDRAQGSFEFGLNADSNSFGGFDPDAPQRTLDGWGVAFTGGESTSTVITQTLDLESADERQTFDDWFTWYNTGMDTALNASAPNWAGDTSEGDAVDGSSPAKDRFTDLLTRESKTSIVEYEGGTWGLGGAVEVALGLKAGIDVGYEDNESSAIQAAYLGAPTEDGSRPSYALPECVA